MRNKKSNFYKVSLKVLWISVFVICCVIWFIGSFCSEKELDAYSEICRLELLKNKDSITYDFEKIDNPNSFNENCVLEYSEYGLYNTDNKQNICLRFYEVTGFQLYFVDLDLDNSDCTTIEEAKSYINSELNRLINDDYAVIYCSVSPKKISTGRSDDDYTYLSISDTIHYGKISSDKFNSQYRFLLSDLSSNAFSISSFYDYIYDYGDVAILEFLYSIDPSSVSDLREPTENNDSNNYEVLIGKYTREEKVFSFLNKTMGVLFFSVIIIASIYTIYLIISEERSRKAKETEAILNAKMETLVDDELKDITRKYD